MNKKTKNSELQQIKFHLIKKKKSDTSQAWWYTPINPSTPEAEATGPQV
jgi:hypothetical protein